MRSRRKQLPTPAPATNHSNSLSDADRVRVAEASLKASKENIHALEQHQRTLVNIQSQLEASRERYVHLYDGAPVGYVTLTRGGCIQEINLLAAQMLGRPRNALIQSPLIFFIAERDHRKFLSHLSLCRKRQMRLSTELELKHRDGRDSAYVEMITLPYVTEETGHEGFRCALIDITARKRAEHELAVAHAALERKVVEKTTLLEILPVGVLIGDKESQRIFGNRATYEILKVPLGTNLSFAGTPDDAFKGLKLAFEGKEVKSPSDLPMQRVGRTGKPLKNVRLDFTFPNGRTVNIHTSVAPLFDDHGKVQSIIATYADVSAREQALHTIRAKESQMALIAEVAPVMLTQCTRDLRYAFVNQAYADLLGKPAKSIIGRPIVEVVGHEGLQHIRPYIDRVLAGKSSEFEAEIEYPKIGKRFMRVAYAPEHGPDGTVVGWVAALLDITERKEEEKRLLVTSTVTQILAESPNLDIAAPKLLDVIGRTLGWEIGRLCLLDGANKRLRCQTVWNAKASKTDSANTRNDTIEWERGTGLPGHVWHTLKPCWVPNLAADRRFRRTRQAADGLHGAFAFPIISGKGFLGVVEFFSHEIREPAPKLLAAFSSLSSQIGQFIERKQAEESLRESEERFRAMADSAPVMIWMSGHDKKCAYLNQRWVQLTGRSLEQELGDGWQKTVHPEDLKLLLVRYEEAFALRGEFELEMRLRRKDGEYVWILNHGTPRFTPSGEFLGYIGSCVEITERKAAEAVLRDSEERFRLLANKAPVGIFRSARNGNSLYVNDAWCVMAGIKPEAARGRGWLRAIHPEDRPALAKSWGKAIKHPGPSSAEFRFLRPDGSIVWAEGQAVPVRDARGRLANFVGTVRDITQRKEAETILRGANEELERRVQQRTVQLERSNEVLKKAIAQHKSTERALRESEERFRLMVEGVQNCSIFMLDPKGNVVTWNDAASRTHGYRAEEIVGKHYSRFFLPADIRSGKPRQMLRLAKETGHSEFQGWHIRKNGEHFWINALTTALRDEQGKLQGFAKVARDITEERAEREAALELQTRLQAILDNSPALIFLKDTQGRYLHVNRRFGETYHLKPEEILGKSDLQLFPKEQAMSFRGNDLKVVNANQSITFDERSRLEDGNHTSIVTKFPLHDADGKTYAVGGIATDITDRLRQQEALFRSQEMLNDFFEQSPLALFWISPGGRIQRVNKAGLELLGYSRDECVSRFVADFSERRAAADVLNRLQLGEELLNYRGRLRRKDGSLRHVLIDANGFWEGGRLLYSRWFVRDITRRVELEQEILAAGERERQRISQDLHDDLCQQLAGVEFLSQTLAGQLKKASPESVGRAREIAGMVRQAINQTRELAHGLSPLRLELVGMVGALQELAERTRKIHGIDCRFHCAQPVLLPDPAWGIHLYRIAQEAVSNAIKHGHCERIDITFGKEDGTIKLALKDDGTGIPEKLKSKGIGLRVMQYRASMIGGTLTVRRNPRRGTTIVCTVKDDGRTQKSKR